MMLSRILLLALLLPAACDVDDADGTATADETPAVQGAQAAPTTDISTSGVWATDLTPAQVEAGRRDDSWRRAFGGQPGAGTNGTTAADMPWQENVDSVLRVQVLLDRALFSPGVIDGKWGKNTEKALYWLQTREGLPATGGADARTIERLAQLAGSAEVIRVHTLSEDDVAGPFVQVPDDVYERAELECLCYENVAEKLAERFHTSEELLRTLNPDVALDAVAAGQQLRVPAVRADDAGGGAQVASLRISDGGHFLHALDTSGRILFHFPTTLGSSYEPSPSGRWQIESITEDPWWHYQPDLLDDVPDDRPDARLPPGPNNAVGVVWMALSKPHYGLHGTSAPETIGYTTSAGCVRLTNWDALFLSRRVSAGTTVRFTETDARTTAD